MEKTIFGLHVQWLSLWQLQDLKKDLEKIVLTQINSDYYQETLTAINFVQKRIFEIENNLDIMDLFSQFNELLAQLKEREYTDEEKQQIKWLIIQIDYRINSIPRGGEPLCMCF